MTSRDFRQSRLGVAALCALVALGAAAFVPPRIVTADAFETPKTLFWCLSLAAIAISGCCSRGQPGRQAATGCIHTQSKADFFAAALLAWMTVRALVGWPVYDTMSFLGWLLPPAMYLAGMRLAGCGTAPAILRICLWSGAVQAALMLLQRMGLDPLFAATTCAMAYAPGRMIGTVGYHNQAVDLLAVCAALWIWRMGRLCREPDNETGIRALLPVALLGPISALAAYRAGFAGVLAGMAALVPVQFRRGLRGVCAAFAVAGILCAACLAVPQMRERAAGALAHPLATPALRTRATMARAAWAMVRERPVVGHGSGSYAFQYTRRVADGMSSEMGHEELGRVIYAREPHNDFLHIWSEFGLIGLVLALGWLVAAWRNQPAAGRFLLGYWAIASCFGFPWHDTAAGPLFGLALGMFAPSNAYDLDRLQPGPQPQAIDGDRLLSMLQAAAGLIGATLCIMQIGADTGVWGAFPWQGRALAREGGLLAVDGHYYEAEAALEASWRLERSTEQCSNLGFVKMKLGKPTEAEAIYREWADSGIDYAKALGSLAGAQEAQGKWLDAGRTLYRLHTLYPAKSEDADLFRTASLLLRGGDAEAARRLARHFQRRNGRTPRWTAEWENLYGAAELRAGRIERARVHFEKALEMKPSLESARRNLQAL